MARVFKGTYIENKLASTDALLVSITLFLNSVSTLPCGQVRGQPPQEILAYSPVFFVTSPLATTGLDSLWAFLAL